MFTSRARSRKLAPSLALAAWVASTAALDFNICASINTGSGSGFRDDLQSNGLCHDYCRDDTSNTWAYAITQQFRCWCSNLTPAESTQVEDGECDQTCPGYPFEDCGSSSGDAWGYIAVGDNQPSGTSGSGGSSAVTTTATERVTETVQSTTTTTISSETVATSSTTTSSSSSTTEDETSRPTAPPTTSMVQTITADGTIKTVTVVPTDLTESDGGASQVGSGDGGLGGGAIAGIVVGVVGGIAIVAIAIWLLLRRRRSQEEAYKEDPALRASSDVMAGHRREMSMSNRSGNSQSPGSAGNRSSTLQIDPRMEGKTGLYMRSSSHESLNTIRDDRDYSRRILRPTNPDPDE